MKRILLVACFILALCNAYAQDQETDTTGKEETSYSLIQLSITEDIQLFSSSTDIYGMRLTLPYGVNRNVYGLDLGIINESEAMYGVSAGFANMVRHGTGGINTALFVNSCEKFYGFQFAGFMNRTNGKKDNGDSLGFQAAIYNCQSNTSFTGIQTGIYSNRLLSGDFIGMQASVLQNETRLDNFFAGIQAGAIYNSAYATKKDVDFYGIQVCGLANSLDDCGFTGMQFAGVLNYNNSNRRGFIGIQASGLFNYNEGNLKGLQTAVLYNNTSETVYGSQVGFVNIADRVAGVQIGLINMARKVNGIQIGLCNIISEGEIPFMFLVNASMSL